MRWKFQLAHARLSLRHQRRVGVERRLVSLDSASRRAPRARPRVGSASIASAWSEWAAITTSSKISVSQPSASTATPPPARRSTRRTGAPRRRRVAELVGDRVHVRARAADDGAPLRTTAQLELAVVVEELGEERDREVPDRGGIGRPDRRDLGHDDPLHEPVRVAHVANELADRRAAGPPDRRAGVAVEAKLVAKHPQELGPNEIRALGEERRAPCPRTRRNRRAPRSKDPSPKDVFQRRARPGDSRSSGSSAR